jgi:hypothetical protein
VIGDGVSTIDQLADAQINTDPRRGTTEDAPLNVVIPSESAEVILELERLGLTPQSIPAKDQSVLIQRNGNVALISGGNVTAMRNGAVCTGMSGLLSTHCVRYGPAGSAT